MNTREKIIFWRESKCLSRESVSTELGISCVLLRIVEEGGVTHPNIALKMKTLFNLTDLECEDLIPLCRRPHGGDYEPNRYVSLVDQEEKFCFYLSKIRSME